MRKWILGIAAILVLTIGSIFIFIPRDLTVSVATPMNCNASGAFRFLKEGGNWVKWWPAEAGKMSYKGRHYRISNVLYRSMEVIISDNAADIGSKILVIPAAIDSTVIIWECRLSGSLNPVSRLSRYFEARVIRRDLSELLSGLRSYLGKNEHIYGMNIRETSTSDTLLVSTRVLYPAIPGTGDFYNQLGKIREYIAANGARETGYPMVNISRSANGQYQCMAAIPTEKALPGNGNITFTRMVPGRFLAAEVHGGERAVDNGLQQLQEFVTDYQRTVMAIPFQSLITDRSRQPDSTQWVTRLYYPVR